MLPSEPAMLVFMKSGLVTRMPSTRGMGFHSAIGGYHSCIFFSSKIHHLSCHGHTFHPSLLVEKRQMSLGLLS